ncbi:hypothetical protein ACSLPC_27640 [Escherichia coli]|uniref:hypothetical protein n=1 Tax=Escherichia coli TaxID=562 RepID=UPI003EE2B9C6
MVEIKFITIWDNGIRVESKALMNEGNKKIVKIFENDIPNENEENLENLQDEYVLIDGIRNEIKEVNGIYEVLTV